MMKKTNEKKQERVTPIYYSSTEDLLSALTHGIGALFGIFALCYMTVRSARSSSAMAVVASVIYGASLIVLYTISTLSHTLTNRSAKKVFRILDHATIFLLIAGTYTPVTLITLKGALGWTIFGIQWGIAAIGIIFDAIALNRFKKYTTPLYVIMGWAILFAAYPMILNMAPAGLIYLLGGGIFYSVGYLFYRLKKPNMHFLWHLFALMGSILQFIAVCNYVLPPAF